MATAPAALASSNRSGGGGPSRRLGSVLDRQQPRRAIANSLDLDPEMGAIELFEEVERALGIVIAAADAMGCATVGDLDALVARVTAEGMAQNEGCASPWIFNQLRRALRRGAQGVSARVGAPLGLPNDKAGDAPVRKRKRTKAARENLVGGSLHRMPAHDDRSPGEHGSLRPGDIRRDTVFHASQLRVSAAA